MECNHDSIMTCIINVNGINQSFEWNDFLWKFTLGEKNSVPSFPVDFNGGYFFLTLWQQIRSRGANQERSTFPEEFTQHTYIFNGAARVSFPCLNAV
jgi:hypothetical protein